MVVYIPPRFEPANLDNFVTDTSENKALIEKLRASAKSGALQENIVIMGDVGVGKSHLLYSFAKELMSNHKEACLTTIPAMIKAIRGSWGDSKDRYFLDDIRDFKQSPVLIVDEAGLQYGTDSERIELFDIFNYRYNAMLNCIVASNYSQFELKKILGRRICDRIFGGALLFTLKGESRR